VFPGCCCTAHQVGRWAPVVVLLTRWVGGLRLLYCWSIVLTYLLTYLPTCPPACPPACLPACLPVRLPACLPARPPAYPPTYQGGAVALLALLLTTTHGARFAKSGQTVAAVKAAVK
jgi:hypothetical protein